MTTDHERELDAENARLVAALQDERARAERLRIALEATAGGPYKGASFIAREALSAHAQQPAPAAVAGEPDAYALTIFEAQQKQPWSVPYGKGKWWVVTDEGRLKHCLAHAAKSLGKIAAAVEKLDHSNASALSDDACDAVGDMAADLVSVALQIGTTVSRSVAHTLVRRVKEKNGALLDPQGGAYGRTLVCK